MTASALLSFTQNFITPGPGISMVGVQGQPVTLTSGVIVGVIRHTFELLDVPLNSAVPTGIIYTGSANYCDFTPDAPPGCYRVKLSVLGADGSVASQIRNFAVPTATGHLILPPFKATAGELNFPGNTEGWEQILNEWLQYLLAHSAGGVEPDTRAVIVQMDHMTPFPPGNAISIPVSFDPPFIDNQYAVSATIVGGDGNYRPIAVVDKRADMCLLRLANDGSNFYPSGVDVIAREAIVEEFAGYSGSGQPPQPQVVPAAMFVAARYLWVIGGAITYTGLWALTGTNPDFSPPTYIYQQVDTPENRLEVIKYSGTTWGWYLTSPHAAPEFKAGEEGPVGHYSGGSEIFNVKYEVSGFPTDNGEYVQIGQVPTGSVYYLCDATGTYLNDWLPNGISQSRPFTITTSAPFPIPAPEYSCGNNDPASGWHTGMFGPIPGATAIPVAP